MAAQVLDYFPLSSDPKTVTWERLETLRLKKLGLSNKYSRHFNVLRSKPDCYRPSTGDMSGPMTDINPYTDMQRAKTMMPPLPEGSRKVNSLAPFATLGKPTCGVFFSRETDNKKKKFGIPASDLVKWRNITGASSAQ